MYSKLATEAYDPVKLERLRHYLDANAERGKPRYYEIYVDNLKAVDKTNDPSQFDDYTVYMTDDTRVVRVLIYTVSETSPRNDKFVFTLKSTQTEKEQQHRQELSGLEVQGKINAAISAERDRIELENLRRQLEEKKQQLEEAEEYHSSLENRITELESNKGGIKELRIGQIASLAIEETIKRNPAWIKKVPLLGSLSGLLSDKDDPSADSLSGANDTDTEASFSKKESSTANDTPLSEADKNRLRFIKTMETFFTEQQYEKLIAIIQGLAAQPQNVDTVHELLYPVASTPDNNTP